MLKYGTDKPDLRNPIEMQDVTETSAAPASRCSPACSRDPKGEVWAIPAPGAAAARSATG